MKTIVGLAHTQVTQPSKNLKNHMEAQSFHTITDVEQYADDVRTQ